MTDREQAHNSGADLIEELKRTRSVIASRSLLREYYDSQTLEGGALTLGLIEYFLGVSELNIGGIEEAVGYFHNLGARGLSNALPILNSYDRIGRAFLALKKNELLSAEDNIESAEAYFRTSGAEDNYAYSQLLILKSDLNDRIGNVLESIDNLKHSLECSEKYGFRKVEFTAYHTLANIHMRKSAFQEALNFATRASNLLPLFEADSNQITNLGLQRLSILLEIGEVERVSKEIDNLRLDGVNAANRIAHQVLSARTFSALKDERRFREHILGAVKLGLEANNSRLLANAYGIGASGFLSFNYPEEAAEWAQKSFDIATVAGDHYHEEEASQLLYEAHKQLGNLREALEFLETHDRICKRNQDSELERQLELADLRMELEKNRKTVEEKGAEAARIRAELVHHAEQLTERTRHLVAQAGIIERFRKELRTILRESAISDPVVKQVRQRLLNLPDFRMNYEEFDIQFSEVHPDFLKRLVGRFPALTRTERRICPLLLLNLKSFEIATLLLVDERSIETHRFSIRRKLEIPKEVTISDFLAGV